MHICENVCERPRMCNPLLFSICHMVFVICLRVEQKCIHHWLSAHRCASAGVYCITVLHKHVNVDPLVHTETMCCSNPSITEEIIQLCTLLMLSSATVTHNLYFYLHHLTSFKPELEPYICLSVFTLTLSVMFLSLTR